MQIFKLVLSATVLVFFSNILFAAEATPLPTAKVGAMPEYTDKVVTVKCKKWETIESDKDGYAICKCDDYLAYRNKTTMNIVKITTVKGREMVKFDPELSELSFPLDVGKKWSSSYAGYTADNGASWNSKLNCEAKAFEKINVTAGSYDTYRIDCADDWTSGAYHGTSHSSRWYAPSIDEIVKVSHQEDSRWNMELKSYQIK